MTTKIPIYKPYLPSKSIEYAKDAIDSGWVSSIGEYIGRATEELKNRTGSKYVVLVNSGTSATHLCARVLKEWRPETKRVFLPSACYIAAYNSLLYDNNDWVLQPVDLDIDTWNMRIPEYEEGDAIMAVHNLGNIMPLSGIDCPVIEDSCETLFGKPKQKQSLCSSLSFFGNKNMTSGEGGAVLTDDEDIYKYVSKLMGQGQTKTRYIHDELGYNYRMTNIQAALLLGQLEEWDNIYGGKQVLFVKYNEAFKDHANIIPQKVVFDHSRWMYAVRIIGSKSYEDNKRLFDAHGIDTRPMFYSFKHHKHLHFLHNMAGRTSANATKLHKEIVILPSYPELTNEELNSITETVKLVSETHRQKGKN